MSAKRAAKEKHHRPPPQPRRRPAPEPPIPFEEAPGAPPLATQGEAIVVTSPEVVFAARVPPPEPVRPRPPLRRGIFLDIENTSRPETIAAVLNHLELDWSRHATDLIAVGNWRVIGHQTARLLARYGAQLVHSAPGIGIRDWSDLRIAVAAGAWLASGRPGDTLEIVTDDQAFDAIGDAAASMGVGFRRHSYRGVAGHQKGAAPVEEAGEPRRRRRRRRKGRGEAEAPPKPAGVQKPPPPPRPAPVHRPAPPPPAPEPASPPGGEAHTAPADEIVTVVEDLLATSPGGVTLDALSNALKSRGFARPPGSPRLVTRLRRIKKLEITRNGIVRLVNPSGDGSGAGPGG